MKKLTVSFIMLFFAIGQICFADCPCKHTAISDATKTNNNIQKENINREFLKKAITEIKKHRSEQEYLSLVNDVHYPPTISKEEYIKILREKALKEMENRDPVNYSNSTVPKFWGTCPTRGNIHIPVFLVEFTDHQHQPQFDQNFFNTLFNSENYLGDEGISVSKYYSHQSYGLLDITFDVYDWHMLTTHPYSYYIINQNTNYEYAIDAIQSMDSEVDFTQYDNDNDGRIDGFVLIHAGANSWDSPPEETWIMKGDTYHTLDGKYLGNIASTSESINSSQCYSYVHSIFNYPEDCRATIIWNTHEFGHVLGLPDLYAINPDTGQQEDMGVGGFGMGELSMMSTNRFPQKPINLDPWSKFYLGWLPGTFIGTFGPSMDSHQDLCNSKVQTLRSIDSNPDLVVLSNYSGGHMNDREFFLISNLYVNTFDPNPDPSNLDNGNCIAHNGSSANTNLGLEINHIDEQYIEDNFLTNSVMHDQDGHYLLDCYDIDNYFPEYGSNGCGHPGIVYEGNTGGTYDTGYGPGLFYTTDVLGNDEYGYVSLKDFDKDFHDFAPPYDWYDAVSDSYNGTQNTRVSVEALDGSGYSITAVFRFQTLYDERPVCINEIMTNNVSAVTDESGDYDNWVELYNSSAEAVDIGGWVFFDGEYENQHYQIPATNPAETTIPANGYKLLWFDNEPEEGPLHIGFEFSPANTLIMAGALNNTDTTRVAYTTFPADVSYGNFPDGSDNWEIMSEPTPGSPNIQTAVDEQVIQNTTELYRNYPNPFRTSTTISFNISLKNAGLRNTSPEQVKIEIYNIKGQKIRTLECINSFDAQATELLSSITWDGKDEYGNRVKSGIYFYKLSADNVKSQTKKMILIR